MVKVPSRGHVRIEVSGGIQGGPAAESLQVGGSAITAKSNVNNNMS